MYIKIYHKKKGLYGTLVAPASVPMRRGGVVRVGEESGGRGGVSKMVPLKKPECTPSSLTALPLSYVSVPQPSSVVAAASLEPRLQTLPQPGGSQAQKPTGLQPFSLTLTFYNTNRHFRGGQKICKKFGWPSRVCEVRVWNLGTAGTGVPE